jgi:Response regulator containing CheY-like receiver domain and AraC-type DNA-binding domain
MHNIVLVDDHPLLRKGLARTIEAEADLDVIGQMDNAEEALGEVEALDPDLVVVDISLPGMSGMELIKHLQSRVPEVRFWSSHDTTRPSTPSAASGPARAAT